MKTPRLCFVLSLTIIVFLSVVANTSSSSGLFGVTPPLDGIGGEDWFSLGPNGGNIAALAIDPVNNDILYAGTNGSMFKSMNGGASWTAINTGLGSNSPTSLIIRSVVIDPTVASTVYAGTFDGVYKSTDSGMSWSSSLSTSAGLTRIGALAIDPIVTTTLYASVQGDPFGGIWKTTNAGASWTTVGCCFDFGTTINVIVSSQSTPNMVYAGDNLGQVFKSTDAAVHWTKLSKIGVNLSTQTLALDPVNSNTIYAGTNSGLFKSIDGGISWIAMGPLTGLAVRSIQVASTDPNSVYAATISGVFKTTDAGATWSATNSGISDLKSQVIAVASSSPGTLYTGTAQGGVFKTINAASSWLAVNEGLCNFNVMSIVINPVARQTMYIGTTTVFKSTDSGATWVSSGNGLNASFVLSLAVDTTSPDRLYAGTSEGVFKTIDGGTSWNALGLSSLTVLDIAVDPVMPNVVYAGTTAGLFKSSDSGASWTISNNGLTNPLIRSVAIDPSNPAVVYVGTNHGQVFKSTDRGGAWTRITDIPVDGQVWLTIHPYSSGIVYAGLGGSVYKSLDGGVTWSLILLRGNVDFFKVAIDPITSDTIFVGGVNGNGGVYRSIDAGIHWTDVTTRTFSPDIQVVAINPTAPGTVFAGTRGGGVLKRSFGDHVDNTPPTISCPSNINVVADRASCSAIVNYAVAASDDSGAASVVTNFPSGSAFPIGTTTINATASDAAGNSSSCSFTITVTNLNPVVTITAPASGSVFPVNTAVSFSGTFTDPGGGTHAAEWTFDTNTQAATVTEPTDLDLGTVNATHTFTTAGIYFVSLVVNDSCGGMGSGNTIDGLTAMVVVYDPNGGFVTGGGWIDSPPGAYAPNPTVAGKAILGFQSKYQTGATVPVGSTEFRFQVAGFRFSSTSYDWLVISGARAQFKGSGTVNGAGNFGFLLTAIDGQSTGGGGVDKFRIKIWDRTNGDAIVYDNQLGAPDGSNPTTTLGGGTILIQKQ